MVESLKLEVSFIRRGQCIDLGEGRCGICIEIVALGSRKSAEIWVGDTEVCVSNGQRNKCRMSRKERASQGENLRITNHQKNVKRKETSYPKLGRKKRTRKI